MLHLEASELGLHCLHNTLKWVSDLKRVKVPNMKTVEFANSVDLDEVAHDQPPQLNLHCLSSTL